MGRPSESSGCHGLLVTVFSQLKISKYSSFRWSQPEDTTVPRSGKRLTEPSSPPSNVRDSSPKPTQGDEPLIGKRSRLQATQFEDR